jgi:hypothetical protein
LEETNAKLEADEDELMEIPKLLKEKNDELMLATMSYCYARLRTNASEAKDITEWITNVRIELKKNIIKKQNREINNKEIYSYMHDIFGKDVVTLFGVHYEDMDVTRAEKKAKEQLAAENEAIVKEESDGAVTKKQTSDGETNEEPKELENYET